MWRWATCVLEGAENCYVRSDGMLAAVVGLKDAVVVVTEDAVLAMHRGQAQDVKKIVERLKAAGRPEAVAHNRSYRPWGYYESLIQGDRFQVKRIVVTPGRQLSLQSHFHRAEHWVVVNGTARVTRDERDPDRAGKRKRLPAAGLRAPAGKSRADSADADRGAVGRLSGRGRYRPAARTPTAGRRADRARARVAARLTSSFLGPLGRGYSVPRRASGSMNWGSVSQGNRIQVSWETSVTKLSTAGRPAGLA